MSNILLLYIIDNVCIFVTQLSGGKGQRSVRR